MKRIWEHLAFRPSRRFNSLVRTAVVGTLVCLIATVTSVVLAAPGHTARVAPAIFVNGEKVRVRAFVERSRVFVPVRGVFEAIDASVEYTAPHFVVIRKDGAVLAAFNLDRVHAIVGRRAVELEAAPTRRDGVMYVPLRVVAEAAGAAVSYTNDPAAVHIRANSLPSRVATSGSTHARTSEAKATARWRFGAAIFTGLCCVGCLVLTARRFGIASVPFRPVRPAEIKPAAEMAPPADPPLPPPDNVSLKSVEATGEAHVRKEIVTHTQTINVPIEREELVIEYAGDGGTIMVEGRLLGAGQTIRIPLWEERVHVDVTRHILLSADIVIGKRRGSAPGPLPERPHPGDFSLAEGNPS